MTDPKTQKEKFIEAAKEHECSEDEQAFKDKLIAATKSETSQEEE